VPVVLESTAKEPVTKSSHCFSHTQWCSYSLHVHGPYHNFSIL